MGGPGAVEGEVLSISFGEASDMTEVAQSFGIGGSTALTWMGHDPF
jgi:hypothetical protein